MYFYLRSELDFLSSSEHYQSNMFHVKIEIEQHKNGISLQHKTRNYSRKPDALFSSDNEKTQFQDLFPKRSKIIEAPTIVQSIPKVLHYFIVCNFFYNSNIFRRQKMFLLV